MVWIGENVEIDPTAEVGYPVFIGDHCRIEAGARVQEDSVLGPGCVIEKGATVRRSILWSGAVVMKETSLDRCIVGADCRVHTNAAIFDGVIVSPYRNGESKNHDR
jgi:mannose-1-phosphate guanylyltransferase/phosphomannomutase